MAEQARLYESYRAGRHPLPVAPPGRSLHNYGLAIDLVSSDNELLSRVWREAGGRWGGQRDPVHFSV
jgi:LAS superfamily LD-carboxypeptidase LdcB